MNKKLSQFFKHPLVVIVAGGVILSAITSIIPDGWSTVFSITITSFSWIWTTLKSGIVIPIWLLSIFILLTLPYVLFLALAIFRKSISGSTLSEYNDQEYGIKWRYDFEGSKLNLYGPYCPDCDLALVKKQKLINGKHPIDTHYCEDCTKHIALFDKNSIDRIKRKIRRDSRKKTIDNRQN